MKRNMKSEGCFFDLPYHYHYQDGAVRKLVMKEKKQLIKESDELWLELSQLANFDDTAYDEELKNSIKDSLELGSEDILVVMKVYLFTD